MGAKVLTAALFLDAPVVNSSSTLYIVHSILKIPIMLRGLDVARGYLWELITSMFIHANIYHLILNIIGLKVFGDAMSNLAGERRVLTSFLLSGLAGNVLSAVTQPLALSVGASGGAFGLFAASAVIDYRRTGSYSLIALLLVIMVLSSVPIYGFPNVVAHIGGAVSGLLLGLHYSREAPR
mgnify:CR=1 FL=1